MLTEFERQAVEILLFEHHDIFAGQKKTLG